MTSEKSDSSRFKTSFCTKVPYKTKKEARKAARHFMKSNWPNLYKGYRCHDCEAWHIATTNRKQIKHNKQHSRGGRRGRRKAVANRRQMNRRKR